MLMQNIQSLRVKITLLLAILIIVITTIITILYIQNLNKLVDSNIELFSKTYLEKEKQELNNKIDLATNVLNMYYQQTQPKYIEKVVKKMLILHQQQLFSQLNAFYEKNKNRYSKQTMQKKLKFLVKYAKYGKSGYFWINDMHAKMIMHPIKPQYNGKLFIDTPKVPFVSLGIKELKKEHKNEVFIKYKFYNPATHQYEFKVSLVKIFKPYNWIIGTGQYLSDITPIIQKRALDDIKALRYGKSGYFWINDMHAKMIMHPIKPQYDGKTFVNTPKVPFVQLGIKALQNSKSRSAIIKYSFYNPATHQYENKLSVVKLFKPWNWVIGTGVYLNAIDNSIEKVKHLKDKEEEKLVYKIVMFSVLLTFSIIAFAYYLITHFIVKPVSNLHNEKKYFEEISQIDFLTNIFNRRAFFDELERCVSFARRNNFSVSIMMIDIDFFKKVNDKYGHEAGDEVLKKLAAIIKNCIREEDIFGRLGGEEFGLCIMNINNVTLSYISEKIRKSVEKDPLLYKGEEIYFTVSIGVYTQSAYSIDIKDALNKADEALYRAKLEGRNRVVNYDSFIL